MLTRNDRCVNKRSEDGRRAWNDERGRRWVFAVGWERRCLLEVTGRRERKSGRRFSEGKLQLGGKGKERQITFFRRGTRQLFAAAA